MQIVGKNLYDPSRDTKDIEDGNPNGKHQDNNYREMHGVQNSNGERNRAIAAAIGISRANANIDNSRGIAVVTTNSSNSSSSGNNNTNKPSDHFSYTGIRSTKSIIPAMPPVVLSSRLENYDVLRSLLGDDYATVADKMSLISPACQQNTGYYNANVVLYECNINDHSWMLRNGRLSKGIRNALKKHLSPQAVTLFDAVISAYDRTSIEIRKYVLHQGFAYNSIDASKNYEPRASQNRFASSAATQRANNSNNNNNNTTDITNPTYVGGSVSTGFVVPAVATSFPSYNNNTGAYAAGTRVYGNSDSKNNNNDDNGNNGDLGTTALPESNVIQGETYTIVFSDRILIEITYENASRGSWKTATRTLAELLSTNLLVRIANTRFLAVDEGMLHIMASSNSTLSQKHFSAAKTTTTSPVRSTNTRDDTNNNNNKNVSVFDRDDTQAPHDVSTFAKKQQSNFNRNGTWPRFRDITYRPVSQVITIPPLTPTPIPPKTTFVAAVSNSSQVPASSSTSISTTTSPSSLSMTSLPSESALPVPVIIPFLAPTSMRSLSLTEPMPTPTIASPESKIVVPSLSANARSLRALEDNNLTATVVVGSKKPSGAVGNGKTIGASKEDKFAAAAFPYDHLEAPSKNDDLPIAVTVRVPSLGSVSKPQRVDHNQRQHYPYSESVVRLASNKRNEDNVSANNINVDYMGADTTDDNNNEDIVNNGVLYVDDDDDDGDDNDIDVDVDVDLDDDDDHGDNTNNSNAADAFDYDDGRAWSEVPNVSHNTRRNHRTVPVTRQVPYCVSRAVNYRGRANGNTDLRAKATDTASVNTDYATNGGRNSNGGGDDKSKSSGGKYASPTLSGIHAPFQHDTSCRALQNIDTGSQCTEISYDNHAQHQEPDLAFRTIPASTTIKHDVSKSMIASTENTVSSMETMLANAESATATPAKRTEAPPSPMETSTAKVRQARMVPRLFPSPSHFDYRRDLTTDEFAARPSQPLSSPSPSKLLSSRIASSGRSYLF